MQNSVRGLVKTITPPLLGPRNPARQLGLLIASRERRPHSLMILLRGVGVNGSHGVRGGELARDASRPGRLLGSMLGKPLLNLSDRGVMIIGDRDD